MSGGGGTGSGGGSSGRASPELGGSTNSGLLGVNSSSVSSTYTGKAAMWRPLAESATNLSELCVSSSCWADVLGLLEAVGPKLKVGRRFALSYVVYT